MKAFAQPYSQRKVRLWTAALGLVAVSAAVVAAAESPAPLSPPAQAQTVRLDYQEVQSSFLNASVSIVPQSSSFEKEPDRLSADVTRGLFRWGGNSTDAMAFIWDRNAGRLFLDLNRNRDLTDDPDGIFTRGHGDTSRFQFFTNVHVPLTHPGGVREVLVDLNLYSYGSRIYCSGGLRSLWAGKVSLNGEDWQMGIITSPFGFGASEKDRLLLRSWAERDRSFSVASNLPETFDFPDKLFLNGKTYKLDRRDALENGRAGLDIRFMEPQPTLGNLQIAGQFIDRLSLRGSEYLVLIDQPEAEVKVPVDRYTRARVRLVAGGAVAACQRNNRLNDLRIATNTPAVLVAGGPLTNSVALHRRGRSLSFTYQLRGANGQIYQLERQDPRQPPEFAVYHDGRKIASGKFQFG